MGRGSEGRTGGNKNIRGAEVAKPKDITIAEHDIDKSWKEWRVDSFINPEGFQRLVKRTYLQLVERAKKRKTIFYRELEGFDELKSTFRDGVARVIAFVVGASSEAELQNGQPPISAILVEKDTGNRGHGCYGLPVVHKIPITMHGRVKAYMGKPYQLTSRLRGWSSGSKKSKRFMPFGEIKDKHQKEVAGAVLLLSVALAFGVVDVMLK